MSIISINIKMKLLLPALLLFMAGNAQKPEAYEMMVEGVKVIVQPTTDEIVEVKTIIKGGVQNYTTTNAGIESLAMRALTECGTESDDKNSFKNKLDKVSAAVYGTSGMDYSSLNLNCIKSDLNVAWHLYVDAFTRPLFDEKEFARIKQDQLNMIRSQNSNPDYAIDQMAKQVAFAGKKYERNPNGTEASVKNITTADAQQHFKNIANKNQVFMVVVGNLKQKEIEQMVHDIVIAMPGGKPFQLQKESYTANANTFKSEKKDFATNYVQAITGGPQPGTKDYNAFMLAMNIMYDRHFLEVRTNNGLSYAPSTYFNGGLTAYAGFGASTTNPNKYIQVMNELVDKTRTKGFTEEEVRNKKTSYVTRTYYNQETNAAQANALASNEVLHNNWRRALTLNDELKNISAKDLSNAFNKYVNHFTWVYQGAPSQVNPKLYSSVNEKLPASSFKNKKVKE